MYAAAATAVACGIVAACGSSPTSTSAQQSEGAGAGGATSASVQSATAALQHALATPSKLPITTPLAHKPPTGKVFVNLLCNVAQCQPINSGMQQAAAALGWTLKSLPFDLANAATLTSAMQEALQYKPVGVAVIGIPKSGWASQLAAYRAAGVPIISVQLPDSYDGNPVIAAIGNDGPARGKMLADWYISASGGKGKVLLVDIPGFTWLKSAADSFKETMAQECAKCDITELDLTLQEQQNNTTTGAVVSALRRDPSIKYVVATDGAFISGLPAALQAVGVTGVHITTSDSTVENEQQIIAGAEDAAVPTNLEYLGWLAIDAAARHLENMPLAADDGGMPEQLYTHANLTTPAESADIPSGFQALFRNLWRAL
jgi:ribose transport system substrate-binding protein